MKKNLLLHVFLLSIAVNFCNGQCPSLTPFIQAVPNTIFPCQGSCSGALVINPMYINGTPPYTFTSNFGTVVPDQPNPGWTTIFNLCAGSNIVVDIVDAAGCTGTDFITMIEPPPVNPSFTITPSCNSLDNGSVTIGNIPDWYFQRRLIVRTTSGLVVTGGDFNPTDTSPLIVNNLVTGDYTFEISFQFTDYFYPWFGCTQSFPFTVAAATLPSALITPAGPTTFCVGSSLVLQAPVAANRSYQWKKGANLISGATLSSYTATAGGNYRVIVTNTVTGCSKTTTNAIVVTVYSLPAATVTPQGPTTFCAGGSVVLQANTGTGLTYKWKKNNVYISGATQPGYTATMAGVYKTVVTKSNGCSKTSAAVTVTVPCREGETISENSFDVKVFPNPSSGDFVFEISNSLEENISIEIFDAIGKLVLKEIFNNPKFNIRDSKLTPGIYSALVTSGENRKSIRILKSN